MGLQWLGEEGKVFNRKGEVNNGLFNDLCLVVMGRKFRTEEREVRVIYVMVEVEHSF